MVKIILCRIMPQRTALILGSTGLVGSECLKYLLESEMYTRVYAVTRRPLKIEHTKLVNIVADFDMPDLALQNVNTDDVYCTLGTTIAKAGSQEEFRKVDFKYPLHFAKILLLKGANRFFLVSATGADHRSSIFYNRVKGELEEALISLPYQSLVILRPSILLGNRNEQRVGEQVGQWVASRLSFLFVGPLANYKGIPATVVAKAMVNIAAKSTTGLTILENPDIFKAAV